MSTLLPPFLRVFWIFTDDKLTLSPLEQFHNFLYTFTLFMQSSTPLEQFSLPSTPKA